MRRWLIAIIVFLIWTSSIFGQSYSKFVIEGAHWEVYESGDPLDGDGDEYNDPFFETTHHFKLEGDSLQAGFVYKKMFQSDYTKFQYNVSHPEEYYIRSSAWQLIALVWEDTTLKKVYIIGNPQPFGPRCNTNSPNDSLFIDFSKNAGDSLKFNFIDADVYNICDTTICFVDSTDTTLSFGLVRKISYISPPDSLFNRNFQLIEGVGPSYGLVGGPGPSFEGDYSSLLTQYCVGNDTVCFGGYSNYYQIFPTSVETISTSPIVELYPNPACDAFFISADQVISEIDIIDITGRVIQGYQLQMNKFEISTNGLSKGLYLCKIYMGQDVLVKKLLID